MNRNTVLCSHCWQEADVSQTHCQDCGAVLSLSCPQCSSPVWSSMVCCVVCGLELSHLPAAPSVANTVLIDVQKIRHPLETARFEKLLTVKDVSFLLHRAKSFTSSENGRSLHLSDSVRKAFSVIAPFSTLSLADTSFSGKGKDVCFSGTGDHFPLAFSGNSLQPVLVISPYVQGIIVDDERSFLASSVVFALYSGLFPYLILARLAMSGLVPMDDDEIHLFDRWLESFWYSADRFSALLFKKPALWLRALIKSHSTPGDDVGGMIDGLLKKFPDKPGEVASVLRKKSFLVRRLVELCDFVKSDTFHCSSGALLRELENIYCPAMERKSSESDAVTPVQLDDEQFIGSHMVDAFTANEGNRSAEGQSTLQTRTASVVYLSSFRNELLMYHRDMSLFQCLRLHDYCRHPRNLTFSRDCKKIFISDFETSRLFCVDYKGSFLFEVSSEVLSHPAGMICDGNNDLWVCDSWNSRVVKFASRNNYSEYAFFLQGDCRKPLDMVWDKARDGFWVCDSGNRRVMRLSEDGDVLFTFGTEVLSMPSRVRILSDILLVLDSVTGKVYRFAPTGEYLGELRVKMPQGQFIDSLDTGNDDEIVLSPRGRNVLLFTDGKAQSLTTVTLPADKSNEWGFPGFVSLKTDLVKKLSS